MRRSHNSAQLIDAIIKAADRLDPLLINEFMTFGIESIEAHFELIKPTLTETQQLHHIRVINTGSIILSLLCSFRPPSSGEV